MLVFMFIRRVNAFFRNSSLYTVEIERLLFLRWIRDLRDSYKLIAKPQFTCNTVFSKIRVVSYMKALTKCRKLKVITQYVYTYN